MAINPKKAGVPKLRRRAAAEKAEEPKKPPKVLTDEQAEYLADGTPYKTEPVVAAPKKEAEVKFLLRMPESLHADLTFLKEHNAPGAHSIHSFIIKALEREVGKAKELAEKIAKLYAEEGGE